MENAHDRLEKLCKLIKTERQTYQQAIKNNKAFSDVKKTYLELKRLECLLNLVMQEVLS